MANKLTGGSSVPWILCHDHKQCADMNHDPASGKYEFQALCTINGFWMDEYTNNPSQPSPKWMFDQLAANPGQPVVWTEDQGWFDRESRPGLHCHGHGAYAPTITRHARNNRRRQWYRHAHAYLHSCLVHLGHHIASVGASPHLASLAVYAE